MSLATTWRTISDYYACRRLWAGLGVNRRIVLVPSSIPNPDDPATGAGELKAAAFIPMTIVAAFGYKEIEVRYPWEFPDFSQLGAEELERLLGDHDLILLGGPEANPLTKLAATYFSESESWIGKGGREPVHWIFYPAMDRQLTTRYSDPEQPNPNQMETDYGIFLVRPNCFSRARDPEARIVLCYGAHTFGTEAAAQVYFSFASAAAITAQLEKRGDPRWNLAVEGVVEVHTKGLVEDLRQVGLNQPEKLLKVVAPASLQRVQLENPSLAQLAIFTRRVRLGLLHQNFGRLWLYIAVAVLACGMAVASLPVLILGALLYAIQRVLDPKERLPHLEGVVADLVTALALGLGIYLFADRADRTMVEVSALLVCVARFSVLLETQLTQLWVRLRTWFARRPGTGDWNWPSVLSPAGMASRLRPGRFLTSLTRACPPAAALERPGGPVEDSAGTDALEPWPLRQAAEAFERDLPALLQEHPGRWIAYRYDAKRLEPADTKTGLLKACYDQEIPDAEIFVAKIQPDFPTAQATW